MELLIFSIDCGDYIKTQPIHSACIKRTKQMFGDKFKIFTENDEIVQEAVAFFGKDFLENRKRVNPAYEADLIRLYILWKLPFAWYIDSDYYIQEINCNLEETLKNKIGSINLGGLNNFTNGGVEEGRNYCIKLAQKIKQDVIENGDSLEKTDAYYFKKFNIPCLQVENIIFFHFERWHLFTHSNIFAYSDKGSSLIKTLQKYASEKEIVKIIKNPKIKEKYEFRNIIPMFPDIWGTKEELFKQIKEYNSNAVFLEAKNEF